MPAEPLVRPPSLFNTHRARPGAAAAAPTRVHAAIVRPECLDMILSGEKTVESRLSVTRREPFGRVSAGDVICFREQGGGYRAEARVSRVVSQESLKPADIRRLAAEFEPLVRAGAAYWRSKRTARFATLIWLEHVRSIEAGPAWTPCGAAWRCFGSSGGR